MKWLREANIQVSTDLNALADVLTWFDQFQAPVMPHMTWLECQLALAEGFTNAVRHAHAGKAVETPIDIDARLSAESMELRIWDYGPGFDFETYVHKASATVDKHAEGGRGLGLIKQIADQLKYVKDTDQRNCLCITKYYSRDDHDEKQGAEPHGQMVKNGDPVGGEP